MFLVFFTPTPLFPTDRYYFFPTDLVLPEWFADVAGALPTSWNQTELRRMHQAAAQGFGPRATAPRLTTAFSRGTGPG